MSPKELKAGSQRDICTPVFTAVLFTIAKSWKQPKCPLTDEREQDVVHPYDGIFLSLKKEGRKKKKKKRRKFRHRLQTG